MEKAVQEESSAATNTETQTPSEEEIVASEAKPEEQTPTAEAKPEEQQPPAIGAKPEEKTE